MKRKLTTVLLVIALALMVVWGQGGHVAADNPFRTYSYDYWHDPVPQPASYLYEDALGGPLDGQWLKSAEDIFLDDSILYIADTGNNRIVRLDTRDESATSIDEVNGCEPNTLNKPQGVFVDHNGNLWIADSGNNRILMLENEKDVLHIITKPESDLFPEEVAFVPTKVVVDEADRVYCISYGVNMGLLEFDLDGEFQGYIGATQVKVNPFDYMWKRYFATDMQKERMQSYIPTEYSNITLTDGIFLLSTVSNLNAEDIRNGADAIRLLNPTGTDILRRLSNYPIVGDLSREGFEVEYSKFVDSSSTDFGTYFVLDNNNGKVFAYDNDGNSLFVFGGKGNRKGNLVDPISMELSDDLQTIYILDRSLNAVIRYRQTDYGKTLLTSIRANRMNNQAGNEGWNKILKFNANSEVAYTESVKPLSDGEG